MQNKECKNNKVFFSLYLDAETILVLVSITLERFYETEEEFISIL